MHNLFPFKPTLFVTISTEDSESWDMECLSTPLAWWAGGVKKDGERGGEFRVYRGITLLCWDSPATSIMPLLTGLSEDIDPSVRQQNDMSTQKPEICDDVWALGGPDLHLSDLHHVSSLFEASHPSCLLTDAVSFCWGALRSSATSSEYLRAAD